jgi:hypothetical protein
MLDVDSYGSIVELYVSWLGCKVFDRRQAYILDWSDLRVHDLNACFFKICQMSTMRKERNTENMRSLQSYLLKL